MSKIKSVNSLMKYLRKEKNIDISGSIQKTALLNMGYYHGYKGCRFYNNKNNKLAISNFYQVQAIYNFDSQVKSILYPHIMFIETALKNYALQNIIEQGNSSKISELFDTCFNAHNDWSRQNPKYADLIRKRADVKSKIYNDLSRNFENPIIGHFYQKDDQVPIWALFEILTLGEFTKLYECINKKIKLLISKDLKFNRSLDADGNILFNIMLTLKNLRNAVAHNNFIYDNRFNKGAIPFRLNKYLMNETGISNINFGSICDYVILVVYMLKCLKVTKTENKRFIRQFSEICENFYKNVNSLSIYNTILPSDLRSKLKKLEKFL